MPSTSGFHKLPTELLLAITSHLPPYDIYALRLISSYFHAYLQPLLSLSPASNSMASTTVLLTRNWGAPDVYQVPTARSYSIEETWMATSNGLLICQGLAILLKRKMLSLQMHLKGCCQSYSRRCSQCGELETCVWRRIKSPRRPLIQMMNFDGRCSSYYHFVTAT